jgi:hypothetical protein
MVEDEGAEEDDPQAHDEIEHNPAPSGGPELATQFHGPNLGDLDRRRSIST